MKYKIGDKVKIKKDLVVGNTYGGDTYLEEMDDIAKDNDYVLTIGSLNHRIDEYEMDEDEGDDPWYWTDAMIEGLAERNMKYKIGDKVRIRRDLAINKRYGANTYIEEMDKTAKAHDYVLTIKNYCWNETEYCMSESVYCWTDEMIEGLAELTDREKFERWMRKLSSLPYDNEVWNAFNYCVTTEPDKEGYEDKLKIISDYLFGTEKKKMTKAEIEKELGYKIEIVEE